MAVDHLHYMAGSGKMLGDAARVARATSFEQQLDPGLGHVQFDSFADVRYLAHAGAGRGDGCEQTGEPAGSVRHPGEQAEATIGGGLVSGDDAGKDADVDVPARENRDCRSVLGRGGEAAEECCGRRGAGAFGEELAALEEENHCLRNCLLADGDNVV